MIKTHKANVKKRIATQTDYGSDLVTYEDLGKISGFMDYLTVTKGEKAGKIDEDSTHIFICKTKLDIEQGDILIVKGKEYEVSFADRPHMGTQLEIELKPTLIHNDDIESMIYFGFSNESEIIETDILSLNSQSVKTKTFTKSINVTAKNLILAYPKSFGKASIRLNSKPITDMAIKEIMVNGTIHYVYTKTNVSGTLHIELF